MSAEIKSLIKNYQFSDALALIENELQAKFDLQNPEQEKKYKELLQLRVTCNTFLDKDDSIILDVVRKDKYPSEINYNIDDKLKVNLLFKNHFDFNCDAFVNTVSWKAPFENVKDNSATYEFVKRLGIENIRKQLKQQKKTNKSDFIILHHPELSAPMSYHILFYDEESGNDMKVLEEGIKNVLNDAAKNKLLFLAFFPLGYALVSKVEKDLRNTIAEEIANRIAESIVTFYYENKSKQLPIINFNFITVLTMQTFDRAFYRWTKLNRAQIESIKFLPIKEKLFINEALTNDPNYIKKLKELFISIEDKSSILILGESGCGKSQLAKIIYTSSNRSSKPFVSINCAMIKPGTIYPQLFGWKKGSYTDAKEDGIGAIEAAEGGVLFLDEIGTTDMEIQAMLLKFIAEGTYSRFGEQGIERQADVRLIFGTNENLDDKIKQETFRLDLYERIAQSIIEIPPLRERKSDIELLTEYFLKKLNEITRNNISITEEAKRTIHSFNWPGNIRQLKTYIERLHNFCKYQKLLSISKEMILSDPPRNNLYNISNPYINLEKSLKEVLKRWNPDDGKLVDDLIQPILAKLYNDESDYKKEDSSKYIGMDSTRGKESTLSRKYEQYNSIREKFLI